MKELLAYLAGCIDSDGTIGVKRSTYAMRVTGDSSQPAYSERLALRHVTKQVPTLLRETFGGSLYLGKPQSVNGRPLWCWSVTDRKASTAAVALLPYLRIKAAQARNLSRLREIKEASKSARVAAGRGHVGSAKRTRQHGRLMELCYLRAKRLNHVGI